MDSKKKSIIIALMVAMFLGAVEGTIVTTAMLTISKELKGLELISYVLALYLLTSAITTPIYGKLSDLYGRKNVLSIGIIIFLVGSSLCGLSQNMYQLIVFRGIQGIGAGSIFTVTYTIVGDNFTLSERAKVQGWLSSVWGIASIVGPFLGGFLIDNLSWHWVFFINIPFGVLSIILLQKNLTEHIEKKKHSIDFAGTILLSGSIISVLYGAQLISNQGTISIISLLGMLIAALLFIVAFYFVEKRVREPIIPLDIFTKNSTAVNAISFLAAAVLIASNLYISLYIQGVLGFSPTVSGLSMAPMSVAWLISSVIIGRAIPKYGERLVTIMFSAVLLFSCIPLLTLDISSPLIVLIITSLIMGFAFGGCFTTLTIIVQSSVDYSKRGAATATNSLLRTVGQTIGVSIFGSMLNMSINKYFGRLGISGIDTKDLYSEHNIKLGVHPYQISEALNSALHLVFIAMVVLSVISLLLAFPIKDNLKVKS